MTPVAKTLPSLKRTVIEFTLEYEYFPFGAGPIFQWQKVSFREFMWLKKFRINPYPYVWLLHFEMDDCFGHATEFVSR